MYVFVIFQINMVPIHSLKNDIENINFGTLILSYGLKPYLFKISQTHTYTQKYLINKIQDIEDM